MNKWQTMMAQAPDDRDEDKLNESMWRLCKE